jgi:hypothetical protein
MGVSDKSKENLNQFKKGESGNPKGRPRKSFATINAELVKKGVEPLTKTALIEAYTLIFNTDEKELISLAGDENTPYGLRLIIKELNNTKSRSKALADYRDYMFGRAKESVDHTTNGKEINIISLGSGKKPEE